MINKECEFFTTNEASQRLGLSVGTVQKLVDKGFLEAIVTQGGHRRILVDSVKLYREKSGYKNKGVFNSIYVIHSGLKDMSDFNFNKKITFKAITSPLELLDCQGHIDCIFIDAQCPWLDSSSIDCINRFSKRMRIFIYNANFLKNFQDVKFEEDVIMLDCDFNDSIVNAYICGKMN
jgi:excisionase family DNA binding protein